MAILSDLARWQQIQDVLQAGLTQDWDLQALWMNHHSCEVGRRCRSAGSNENRVPSSAPDRSTESAQIHQACYYGCSHQHQNTAVDSRMAVSTQHAHNCRVRREQRYLYQMTRAAVRRHLCWQERPSGGRNLSVGTPHTLDVVDRTFLASLRRLQRDLLHIRLGCHRTRTEEFV